jgi:hypothetical protein
MTCLVTIAFPNFRLAGADTRLNLTNQDGSEWKVDGAFPNAGMELKSGANLTVPFSERKIRRIGQSWAAAVGEFVTTQLAFSTLQSATSFDSLAEMWKREREGIHSLSHSETELPAAEITNTVLLVAAPRRGVFTLTFGPSSPVTRVGSNAIVWPHGVDNAVTNAATERFRSELRIALYSNSVLGVVRAVLRVFRLASELSSTVGPNVQIGLSMWSITAGTNDYYFDGDARELLKREDLESFRTNAAG